MVGNVSSSAVGIQWPISSSSICVHLCLQGPEYVQSFNNLILEKSKFIFFYKITCIRRSLRTHPVPHLSFASLSEVGRSLKHI